MNIDMNMKIVPEKEKIKKRVSFANGTKDHDGQTENNILFCKIILQYFNKHTIKNESDVYEIIKHEQYMIFNLLAESIIILIKLNEIKKEEDAYLLIKKSFPKTEPKKYNPKDFDELLIMQKWEIPKYNISAHKKCNGPKGIQLARRGSRIYSEKLITAHIPHLANFIKILWKTYQLILDRNSINI